MIAKENFTEEHIRQLQKQSKRDPILLERTVYAFGLLEAITRVGLFYPPVLLVTCSCILVLLSDFLQL